ncbi:hypothetical protein D3C85_392560 [compost metagenome]
MFVIKTQCKEVVSVGGSVLTHEGHQVWVCNEADGWVKATGESDGFFGYGVPSSIKVFETRKSAENFIKKWKGHPWYYVPNGKYEIFEVEPNYKQVVDGYKIKENN